MFAWMGPFIGALIRPIGGSISDKLGGARVTQIISAVMVVSALGVAYFMKQAYSSTTPEEYFMPFLILFLVLFAATGIYAQKIGPTDPQSRIVIERNTLVQSGSAFEFLSGIDRLACGIGIAVAPASDHAAEQLVALGWVGDDQ